MSVQIVQLFKPFKVVQNVRRCSYDLNVWNSLNYLNVVVKYR